MVLAHPLPSLRPRMLHCAHLERRRAVGLVAPGQPIEALVHGHAACQGWGLAGRKIQGEDLRFQEEWLMRSTSTLNQHLMPRAQQAPLPLALMKY